MNIEDRRKWNDDLRRIRAINDGTPGHEWMSRGLNDKNNQHNYEIDPSKLNLNEPEDFLQFLQALLREEVRARGFLSKIPATRLDQLKQRYAHLNNFFFLLNPRQ